MGNNEKTPIEEDFKVYYYPVAPGVSNLFAITSYHIVSDKVNSEWYYINGNNGKNVVVKGTFSYPTTIYGENSESILNSLFVYCRTEIFTNIILPHLNNDLAKYYFAKINFDLMSFNFVEVDRTALALANKTYKNELEKIKTTTEIDKLKTYLNHINNIKYEAGKII